MKIYTKMSWVGLANYIINNLKEGDTIEFATDYADGEGYNYWYFIRIVCIPEYQSRFIIIDYCGGEEAYSIPLNNYSHEFDEDDKNCIREHIKDYFTWCNNLGFEDAPVWVEEEV